jgi:hypothetical protein
MFFVPFINAIVMYLTYKYSCHRQVLELHFSILMFLLYTPTRNQSNENNRTNRNEPKKTGARSAAKTYQYCRIVQHV